MLRIVILYGMLFLALSATAQLQQYALTEVPFNDLQFFSNTAKNWKIVKSVKGSYTQAQPQTTKGQGVLYNDYSKEVEYKSAASLTTKLEHGDVFVSLDFLMPRGSNSGIYFQGRYEIQLFDSWQVKIPRAIDCGGIYERWDESRAQGSKGFEGHPPRSNASLAPNTWQHLEVEFQAPRFDATGKKIKPAQFVKVLLNGLVIHENVIVEGPTRAAAFTDEKATGPLVIQGDHGPIAFRNLQYALLNDFQVKITDLTYAYHEGKFPDFKQLTKDNLIRSGKAEAITVKLADNPNEAGLVFSGKLNVSEASTYQFRIKKIGYVKLVVDGEEIIKPGDAFQDDYASKNLTAGEHALELSYRKDFSWAPSGVGLFLSKANSRPQALHEPNSLPRVAPTPLMQVAVAGEPEIVRSFMEHEGKKKTYIISVGDVSGVHFAYDLKQGGLLKVWRGDFLNVTDMWYERGEPQTASALGGSISFVDRAPIAMVPTDKTPLPDTLDDTSEFIYKGYKLNDTRSPVFQYQYKNLVFEDLLKPTIDGKGLSRTLTVGNVEAGKFVYLRLAQGSIIEKVEENIYAIDNQRYFVQLPPTLKLKPEIKLSAGKSELVIPISTAATLEYFLIW